MNYIIYETMLRISDSEVILDTIAGDVYLKKFLLKICICML